MGRVARLLGLTLSSMLLVPMVQIPSVLKPLKATQPLAAQEIPACNEQQRCSNNQKETESFLGEFLDVGETSLSILTQEPWNLYLYDHELKLAVGARPVRQQQQPAPFYPASVPDLTLEELQEALENAKGQGDRYAQAEILNWLGINYFEQENFQAAFDHHIESLEIFLEIQAYEESRTSLSLASLASLRLEDYEGLRDLFNRLLEPTDGQVISERLHAITEYLEAFESRYYHDIARKATGTTTLNNWDEAISILRLLYFIENQLNGLPRLFTIERLGVSSHYLGEYEQALAFYREAYELSFNSNSYGVIVHESNLQFRAMQLNHMALTYKTLGQYEKAHQLIQEALLVLEESCFDVNCVPNSRTAAYSFGYLGLLLIEEKRCENALAYLNISEIAVGIGGFYKDYWWEPAYEIMNGFSQAYFCLGDHESAIQQIERVLSVDHILEDQRAFALYNLAILKAQIGEYSESLRIQRQALTVHRQYLSLAGEARSIAGIALVFETQEYEEIAITFYKQAINLWEEIRLANHELSLELRQSFAGTVSDDYRALADLLLQQGRIPEAQQVLDLLKLEELREFTDTRAVWTSDGLQLTTAEQTVADAHDSLIALGADLIDCERSNCPDLDTLYTRQEALLGQYDREVARFTVTIRDNRGDDAVFQDPESISGDAQDLLEAYAAEGETALLIYPFVLEDKLWLVWATVGNVIGSIEVPVARGELSATVQRLGGLLQNGDTRNIDDLQATSQQLYDWLIAPLETELAANDIDHLVFVNDRVTRYIPMAVLHNGEQYLLERYTLSTVLAPGATEMGDRLSTVAETPVLGLGVTRPIGDFNALPAVGAELAAIVQDAGGNGIYPGQVFLDDAFTFETLRSNVADHRVLHIATHAEFVPGRKEDSYILLGDGNPLRIPDIEQLERRWRNIHLVVLSACQTALGGPDQDGAEIAGLSSYFLEENRAEAVIASLWSVNDASTSVLMQRFYALLATGAFTKAEALRQAQLSLLKGEDLAALETRLATRAGARPQFRAGVELPPDIGHRHPYHWAPFILMGNGL